MAGKVASRHALVLSGDKEQRTILKGVLRQLSVVAHIAAEEEEGLRVP